MMPFIDVDDFEADIRLPESHAIFENAEILNNSNNVNRSTTRRIPNNLSSRNRSSSNNSQNTNRDRHQGDAHNEGIMRQSLTWSIVKPNGTIPPPRSGAASVVVQGILYIFGGYGGGASSGRLDDFYQYNFTSGEWKEVEVLSEERPACRENNGVVIGESDNVYLFGGYNGAAWLNDLWCYSIKTKRWTCLQESSDSIESNGSGAIDGITDRGFGVRASSSSGATLSSSQISANRREKAPSRRFGYVSVVHDNKLVVFAGFDGSRWLQDMYSFDFKSKTWAEVHATGQLPSARSCPAWAKDETYVYIHGGYDGVQRKSDFFRFNLNTLEWKEMPSHLNGSGNSPSARYFHSCCLYSNQLIVYGGYSGSLRLSDMYAFDFDTELWSRIDCSYGTPPKGRSSLVAQIYENSLYVGFGYDGDTVLNDFYKFRLRAIRLPPSTLLNDFSKLLNNPQLSDVTFLIEDQEIHANRSILAVRSEFFYALLFSGGMRESIQVEEDAANEVSAQHRRPIEIKDVSHSVFLKVLEYLYTDSVSDLTLDMALPLLITSERYMLDRLKAFTSDYIRHEINADNVMGVLISSHRHAALDLKEIAFEFICQNLANDEILENLTDLKVEPDLLVEIIRRRSFDPLASMQAGRPTHQASPSSPSSSHSNQHRQYNHQSSNASIGPFGRNNEWSGIRR